MALLLFYFLIILALFTVGPIIIFYKNKKLEYDNKFLLILPPAALALYIYLLVDHQYSTQTGFYLLIICIALSAYSTVLTAIMYNQYRNDHKNTPDE